MSFLYGIDDFRFSTFGGDKKYSLTVEYTAQDTKIRLIRVMVRSRDLLKVINDVDKERLIQAILDREVVRDADCHYDSWKDSQD